MRTRWLLISVCLARRWVIAADSTMSTGTVMITAVDNSGNAPNKQVRVSGTSTNVVGVVDPDDVLLVIADDEGTPTVTLHLSPEEIQESGSPNVTAVTATLNRTSSAITTVTVAAGAGLNTVAGDFRLVSTDSLLIIAANATASTGTVTITAVNNDTDAPNKKVIVGGVATNSTGVDDPGGCYPDDRR